MGIPWSSDSAAFCSPCRTKRDRCCISALYRNIYRGRWLGIFLIFFLVVREYGPLSTKYPYRRQYAMGIKNDFQQYWAVKLSATWCKIIYKDFFIKIIESKKRKEKPKTFSEIYKVFDENEWIFIMHAFYYFS